MNCRIPSASIILDLLIFSFDCFMHTSNKSVIDKNAIQNNSAPKCLMEQECGRIKTQCLLHVTYIIIINESAFCPRDAFVCL
jgi:hypothetical protein